MPSIGFIDAGELVTTTSTLGILHPTGYPLYTLLGYAATNFLPLGDDPAWRLNVLSAFFGATALGVFFVLVHRLLTRLGAGDERLAVGIATAATGLLAASHSFWLWAVQAKAYTLHETFVAVLVLLALESTVLAERAPSLRALHGLAFLVGLALTNHVMTVLLVPGLLALVAPTIVTTYRRGWLGARQVATIAMVAAVPLLLYLYLPIRAAQQPLMDWGAPVDAASFWRHVTGWQYRSYVLDADRSLAEKLAGTLGLSRDQFHPVVAAVVAPLVLVGMLRLWAGARRCLVATLLIAAAQLGFATTFGSTPEIHESYFAPFYMMALLWVGAGLLRVSEALRGRWSAGAVLVLVLALPCIAVATNFPRNDHGRNRLAPKFIENVYRELDDGALVVTDLWELVSGSYYVQLVRGVRRDLTIVDINLARYPWYVDQLMRLHPELLAPLDDVVRRYRELQELFVSGRLDASTTPRIQEAYLGFLRGLVAEQRARGRPVHALFQDLYAYGKLSADEQAIVGPYFHPAGLTIRIDAGAGPQDVRAPQWDLAGITTDPAPKDRVAKSIAGLYPAALDAVGRYKRLTGADAEGRRLQEDAKVLRGALTLGPLP